MDAPGVPQLYPSCDFKIWSRTCNPEIVSPIEGTVTGTIPPWLQGSLIRNGPGGINSYAGGESKHLFDGPGLLQKFTIKDSKATYMNRYVKTKSHERNRTAQRLVLNEFGTCAVPDPCHTIFYKFSALFQNNLEELITDTANISIHPFGDEVYTLAETPFAHRIDLETLETLKNVNVNTSLGLINHTSHPHIEADKVYNVGQTLNVWDGPCYVVAQLGTTWTASNISESAEQQGELSPWDTGRIIAKIPCRWLFNVCYMHSFSMTPNYFIIIEQPLAIWFPGMALNLTVNATRSTLASMLQFYADEETIFHVIPRTTTSESTRNNRSYKFYSKAFFFLHTINAFEEETTQGNPNVVVDVCTYDNPDMINCMFVEALKNAQENPDYARMFRGRPKRYRMNLSKYSETQGNGTDFKPEAHEETIIKIGCETPRINYDKFNGKPYRYFYAISADVDKGHPGLLIKVDTLTKTFETWGEPELKSYPSEPIFVPNPDSRSEDDGIILTSLLYGGEPEAGPNKVTLAILDAKLWVTLAKVDFETSGCVPKCLHGWFFPMRNAIEENGDSK